MGFFARQDLGKTSGQSVVETLIIMGTGLFIMLVLVSMVYDNMSGNYATQQQIQGRNAAGTLAREIDDAYFLGPGTVKNVVIEIPKLVDFNKSYIKNRTLVLNVSGTDIAASTNVDITGSWPNSDGSYLFVISAYDDFVYVSAEPASFTPPAISTSIVQGSSTDVNVVFTNLSGASRTYLVAPNLFGDASVSFSQTNPFSISADSNIALKFTVSCSRNSFGSYDGNVIFVPQGIVDSNLILPVRVYCSSAQTRLVVLPSSKSISADINANSSDSVLVCNNSPADFSPSSATITGEAAKYLFTSLSGTLSANSCKSLAISIKAPSGAGTYGGLLEVTAGGLSSTASLTLFVGGEYCKGTLDSAVCGNYNGSSSDCNSVGNGSICSWQDDSGGECFYIQNCDGQNYGACNAFSDCYWEGDPDFGACRFRNSYCESSTPRTDCVSHEQCGWNEYFSCHFISSPLAKCSDLNQSQCNVNGCIWQ